MVGGDENTAKDMGLFVGGCQTVSRELDCFVPVAHHMPRRGNNERGTLELAGDTSHFPSNCGPPAAR
jgi:hypothetical protein